MESERWQRIEQLYHAALQRAAGRRTSFLEETCADDPSLRREVEGLLAADAQASGFMSAPAIEIEAKNMVAEMPTTPLGIQDGQELSHYRILSHIDSGGMGEVFLARDSRLERRVALKLLPVKFTQNAEYLQRFIREAKAASALNHPNIITIHEIGEVVTAQGKTHFIATEFIEGETLRTWTGDEENGLPQILNIVAQVASALDAAHKAGIVHRDIKPENLMVRPDRLVKVLDFGVAKLTPQASGGVDSEAATLVEAIKTRAGITIGTLRYMSPEQARGRIVDARSDLFSLGVVLYELLTGQRPFDGESDADVVAAILHREAPPLTKYLSAVPADLERIVQKALAKDADQRYQNARDLQIDLETLMQQSDSSARLLRSGSEPTEILPPRPYDGFTDQRFSLRQLLLLLVFGLLVAGAIRGIVDQRGGQVETPPPESLKTAEVVTWQSAPGEGYSIGSFSPDGKWVAFTSTQDGSENIWIKQSASGDAEPSTKDEFRNVNSIWSPNAEEIAFYSNRGGQPGIWRKPPFGGTTRLLKLLDPSEGNIKLRHWAENGTTIYYESKQNLFALDVNSGQTNQLTNLDTTKVTGNSLSISPDEQHVAYISTNDAGGKALYVLPVRGGEAKPIAQLSGGGRNTVWHPDGERVLYSAIVDGTYQVFVADIEGRNPVQITFGEKDISVLSVSRDGTKVLYGSSEEKSDVWGVNVARAEEFTVASDISSELWPSVSPDSRTVAYQAVRNLSQGNKINQCSILTKQLDTSAQPSVLAQNGALPRWSPDGIRLAFLRVSNNVLGLWAITAFSGEEKQLTTGGLASIGYSVFPYQREEASNFDWSPDSSTIVYCSRRAEQRNLWLVAVDGSIDIQLTKNTDANLDVRCPLWSGDGKRIAYSSNPLRITAQGKVTYSVWINEVETQNSKIIYEAGSFLRLIGWSPTDQELILATIKKKVSTGEPTEVQLLLVSARTRKQRLLTTLPAAYLYNIHLSADRRVIAFSSHQENKDNIWVFPAKGGAAKKLTTNNDPKLYFSSLAWSPDSRTIYFGKQMRYSQLWMITNFK